MGSLFGHHWLSGDGGNTPSPTPRTDLLARPPIVRSEPVEIAKALPSPDNFMIEESVKIGKVWVSVIRYPGAEFFEGRKIILTRWDPRDKKSIDPHFIPGNGLIARFEPTLDGHFLAKEVATMMKDR